MIYFVNVKTLEEAKKLFYKLAKEHHPDKGGDLEAMKVINSEYDRIIQIILKGGDFTKEQREQETELSGIYKEKAQALADLEGIVLELVGNWLWVTGSTYPFKDKLKESGFLWAKKKLAWFWRPEDAKSGGRGKLSLEEIKGKYGSVRVSGGGAFKLS